MGGHANHDAIGSARHWFAEELRFVAHVSSSALVKAFATVPRERFVGPGPWRVRSPMARVNYWTTEDANPRHVYHDILIALDESRGLNNGQPSLWAALLDHLKLSVGEHVLHFGCGTGYYSAILAELVGQQGMVTAVEIDAKLAEKARRALEPWQQVRVITADGASHEPGPVDAIVASAGATHPQAVWLDSLNSDGRLLMPLTAEDRGGVILLVTRLDTSIFAAHLICPVGFIEFVGMRDPVAQARLSTALEKGDIDTVSSLRRDAHEEDASCWLHSEHWCLSRLNPNPGCDDGGLRI
jgi:protein-L-isoaspartate(D-aspartate) O-methyltransferase